MFEYIEDYQVYKVVVGREGREGSLDSEGVVVLAKNLANAVQGALQWFSEEGIVSSDTVPHSVEVLEWAPIKA